MATRPGPVLSYFHKTRRWSVWKGGENDNHISFVQTCQSQRILTFHHEITRERNVCWESVRFSCQSEKSRKQKLTQNIENQNREEIGRREELMLKYEHGEGAIVDVDVGESVDRSAADSDIESNWKEMRCLSCAME